MRNSRTLVCPWSVVGYPFFTDGTGLVDLAHVDGNQFGVSLLDWTLPYNALPTNAQGITLQQVTSRFDYGVFGPLILGGSQWWRIENEASYSRFALYATTSSSFNTPQLLGYFPNGTPALPRPVQVPDNHRFLWLTHQHYAVHNGKAASFVFGQCEDFSGHWLGGNLHWLGRFTFTATLSYTP